MLYVGCWQDVFTKLVLLFTIYQVIAKFIGDTFFQTFYTSLYKIYLPVEVCMQLLLLFLLISCTGALY